jgi:hypothetical protein
MPTFHWLLTVPVFFVASAFVPVPTGRADQSSSDADAVRAIPATGFWSDTGKVPDGFDPAFAHGFFGWTGSKSGSAAAFHFKVQPSGKYLVAIGFFDPNTKARTRLQEILIDGRKVDMLDPAGPTPFLRLYEVADLNGDGYLQVSAAHVNDECGATGLMNIVWLFRADAKDKIDAEALARGKFAVKPLFRLEASSADRPMREHVKFPKLADDRLKRMLPLRPVALDMKPARPQPVDPRDLEIQGELRDRIRMILDRWGYAGRDQKLVAGFLADAGFDTSGRALEVYCMLSRLMKVDLDVNIPFEALLARQQKEGEFAGAFLGGAGKPRLACSWEQGTLLQAMLAYYEYSGDPRALESAARIVDWEDRMIAGKTNVGSWGGNGRFGALEGLVNYAWRTKDQKALDVAKTIADVNRGQGGIRWMFRGEPAQDAHEHLHSALTTVRGFPWLFALTGDRSYLDDSLAACDRIFDACTWENGCVSEWTSPAEKHVFGTDEGCCTADEVMLSYLSADLTGEGRFFDRADDLYYNALRFHQWFQGDFNGYSDPHIGVKGPPMWYCCTWWGAKAFYETARHLYASSDSEIYVNGFMPSQAELPLKDGTVGITTEANVPVSGDVRITVTPKNAAEFSLKIRVPGWAVLRDVQINARTQQVQPNQGYVKLQRAWQSGDRVDAHFDMPLRVSLSSAQGPTPLAQGKVSIEGAAAVLARSIVIHRGPAILAIFRLQNGCDLTWGHTGDDPYRFETLASVPDEFTLGGELFRNSAVPEIVNVNNTPEGVRLDWAWKTGPDNDWQIRRSALVKSSAPLDIQYSADLISPKGAPDETVDEVVRTGRFCGTRMPGMISAPSSFFDRTGHRIPPHLTVDGAAVEPKEDKWHARVSAAELSSGAIRYIVRADGQSLAANACQKADYRAIYNASVKDLLGASLSVNLDDSYGAIYGTLVKKNGDYSAACRLTITSEGPSE